MCRRFLTAAGRYLREAEPCGLARHQTAAVAVRAEPVVGAGDIDLAACQADSNGSQRPFSVPAGIRDASLPRPAAPEDRMPTSPPIPHALDDAVEEIASILAQGFLRHRKKPSISADFRNENGEAGQSGVITEKGLMFRPICNTS